MTMATRPLKSILIRTLTVMLVVVPIPQEPFNQRPVYCIVATEIINYFKQPAQAADWQQDTRLMRREGQSK